jgi:hypothetical protein
MSQDESSSSPSLNLQAIPRPLKGVEVNVMFYDDPTRGQRQIWTPKGTASTASQLLKDKNWDELAKFELWSTYYYLIITLPMLYTNIILVKANAPHQQYKESDYFYLDAKTTEGNVTNDRNENVNDQGN